MSEALLPSGFTIRNGYQANTYKFPPTYSHDMQVGAMAETVQEFALSTSKAIQRKAIVELWQTSDGFGIAFTPWDGATEAQRLKTDILAASGYAGNIIQSVLSPAAGAVAGLGGDLATGAQSIGNGLINTGDAILKAVPKIISGLPSWLPLVLIVMGVAFVYFKLPSFKFGEDGDE